MAINDSADSILSWMKHLHDEAINTPCMEAWISEAMGKDPIEDTEFEVVESKLHKNYSDETLVIEEL